MSNQTFRQSCLQNVQPLQVNEQMIALQLMFLADVSLITWFVSVFASDFRGGGQA